MPDQDLAAAIEAIPFWWHSIQLPEGMITPGHKTSAILEKEWQQIDLDVTGRSVLDVGAWDGYFSFRAEAEGASSVTSLDSFIWGRDNDVAARAAAIRKEQGLEQQHPALVPGALGNYDTLPGRKGYDLAHRALGSEAVPVIKDFETDDLADLGQFDVVLFLGVLYHLENPFAALRRLKNLCTEVAVIETEGMVVGGVEEEAMWRFAAGSEISNDPTNWWIPNLPALIAGCRAAGFQEIKVTEAGSSRTQPGSELCRLTIQAWV
jgi:tRNA (mo5U34)-methyltransferase